MGIKRTIREKKFIKAYIENGGNATQAYRAVNPNYKGNSARELGRQQLTKVDISDDEIMQELGITDNYLYEKLQEGTNATKITKQGDKVDDFAVRHQYIDTLLKLKNKYPAEKKAIDMTGSLSFVIEKVDYTKEKKSDGNSSKN